MIIYAQCSVNAGGNATICGTSYTLEGTSSGSTSGTPVWTLVSKPAGAPNPVVSNVNSLTPNVTGMTSPGNYVFQLAQNCSPSGSATSQVTITAPGANTGFTAGPDITNVNATTGTVTLNGVVPAGYTASWSAYNIYTWERSSIKTSQNSQFSSTTSATTTFSLIKKADHDIDPAYVVTLKITSINNPSCSYEDTAIVRFIPNPQIILRTPYSECVISNGSPSIPFEATSPKFSQGYPSAPGSSGNFGTTISMNVVSQPGGGNIAYQHIRDNNIYLTGINVVGTYKFTLTVANSAGTYTTPELTYTFNGTFPNSVSFLTAARPEQMMIYYSTGSGGEVHCNFAGQMAPITVMFALDSSDPVTLTSTVTNSGTLPPGGAPVLSTVSGSGTSASRSFTVTPPTGGWRVGTYVLSVATSNGTCSRSQLYYIHISDGNRPNVTVPTTTVCYSGSGAVTATIPLPAVYKGVVNTSYFQDFDGSYRLTLVSKPAGAADPVFEPYNNTLFTNTNTTISNLNMQGEYVFKIKADSYNTSIGAFLDKEYACSGTSLEGTFSVFVSAQIGANAGSAQTLIGTTQTTFNANNPGVATGAWTLLTKPATATDPVIATPSAYNTNVTGFNTPGVYTFRWTVTTGSCVSTSDLTISVLTLSPGGVSGADFWVKSDDAGDITTAWKDHSANADNIPNVGGMALSPADRAHNFHPFTTGYTGSKFFRNTASVLNSVTGIGAPSNYSIFTAVRPTSIAAGRIIGLDDDSNAADPGMSITSAGAPNHYEYWSGGAGTTNTSFTSNYLIGASNVFSATADNAVGFGGGTSGSSGGEKTLGLNGTYETTTFGGTNRFQLVGKQLRIGDSGWTHGGPFPGDIMELVWYNRLLTPNEQSRINSYLAIKNGTTLAEDYLAANSSTVWSISAGNGTISSYSHNIFGIARDNISTLHQKQAASTALNQKLVIGNGNSLFDSNAANTNDLSDGQFLLVGDNDLKQSLAVPLVYTSGTNGKTNYRFEAIWKVQNTGVAGQVTVAWPKGVKNLYLVQSADETFTTGSTFTPMATEVSINGEAYNTTTAILADGQYFTFAGFIQTPGGVIGTDFWVRSDDADAISTAWKDNSPNADDIPNVGGVTLSIADRNHNFHPYTTGYTSSKVFQNNSSKINPNGATVTNPPSNYSLFSAVRPTSIAGGRIMGLDDDNNAADPSISINSSGLPNQYEYWNSTGAAGTTSSNFSTPFLIGTSNVFSATANNTVANGGTSAVAGGEKRLGLNGTYESFSGFPATNTFQLVSDNLRIGHSTWTGNIAGAFPGDIMELVWYNRLLTANEQSRVNSYLAVKNGTTLSENYLSTDSNVVWDRTINTGYNNNIFGIAKDEFTALDQKQSGSTNGGQKLVISTPGFADNNVVNGTSLVNDMQYLMTGDNGLLQSLKVALPAPYAGTNGEANHRFESIWKVQNTENVETITVAWPKGVQSIRNFYLVQSPDASFENTDTFTPMTTEVTVNGVVYNTANVTLADGQYFTFAGFVGNYCTTGCNDNTYLNATDPNTIEYDNIIADETTTIVKQKDGSFYVWGPNSSPNVSSSNANVVLNLLEPTKIDPATILPTTGSSGDGFNYTGTPLKAAIASVNHLLTTDGLYVWGNGNMYTNTLVNNAITYRTPSGFKFGKLTVNSKADGLPPGVSPTNVKMMTGNQETLSIVTCNGAAWVLSQSSVGSVYGDGTAGSIANNSIWHRVKTSATETLDNVVAVRGIRNTKLALTSDGKLYTWGLNTFLNDNNNPVTSNYATEISVPTGVTPKMIGMTEGNNEGEGSYYLLATDGRLFAMGYNGQRQLGLGDTTTRLNWTEVTATSGSNTLGGNIAWISPAENVNNLPSINVLSNDGKQWGWGRSSQGHLGVVSTGIDPTFMPGNGTGTNELGLADKVIAVKDGGQHAINFKENSAKFGFIGLNTFGSKGDGTSVAGTQELKYTYISDLDLCAITGASFCYKPGITTGTALDTKVGITSLSRAGATDTDNWPMVRKGGWLALEAKSKGFVPNRVAFDGSGNPVGIPAVNFVEGMMVYDTTNKCMKIYTLKEGDASMAWHCISTQTCPD